MSDGVVRVRRRRRVIKRRPLRKRRPGLILLVFLGVGLVAALLASAAVGLADAVGDLLHQEAEEEAIPGEAAIPRGDAKVEECMALHMTGFQAGTEFSCMIPCQACHESQP